MALATSSASTVRREMLAEMGEQMEDTMVKYMTARSDFMNQHRTSPEALAGILRQLGGRMWGPQLRRGPEANCLS